VQVVGAAVGGGVHADQVGVDLLATGQPAQAGLVDGAAVRPDLARQHLPVGRDGRPHGVGEDAVALSGEGSHVDVGVGRRRGPAQRIGLAVFEVAVQVADGGVDEPGDRDAAGRDAGTVPPSDLFEGARNAGEPDEVAVGVRLLGDADHRQEDHQSRRRRRERVGDRVFDGVARDAGAHLLGLLEQHRAGDAVVGGQPGRVDGAGPLGDRCDAGCEFLLGLGAEVGEPVLAVADAHQRGQQGLSIEEDIHQFVGELDYRRQGVPPCREPSVWMTLPRGSRCREFMRVTVRRHDLGWAYVRPGPATGGRATR
jgi:hypothetical protein